MRVDAVAQIKGELLVIWGCAGDPTNQYYIVWRCWAAAGDDNRSRRPADLVSIAGFNHTTYAIMYSNWQCCDLRVDMYYTISKFGYYNDDLKL